MPYELREQPAGGILSHLTLHFPPGKQTILAALACIQPDATVDDQRLVLMVKGNPMLAAHLIHESNGSTYGFRNRISSIEQAIYVLGTPVVLTKIVSLALSDRPVTFSDAAGHCLTRIVKHSVATAYLAQIALRRIRGAVHENHLASAFTAGLLHDVGKLILFYSNPPRSTELFSGNLTRHVRTNDKTASSERLLFGYDHLETGQYVAKKLSFPPLIERVIRSHHIPQEPDGTIHGDVSFAVACANDGAKRLGYAVSTFPAESDTDGADPAETHLSGLPMHISDMLQREKKGLSRFMAKVAAARISDPRVS